MYLTRVFLYLIKIVRTINVLLKIFVFERKWLSKNVENDIMQIVIRLTEVELTTWSIIIESRPSGQESGRVGSFLCSMGYCL